MIYIHGGLEPHQIDSLEGNTLKLTHTHSIMHTLLQDPSMSPATAPRAPHIVPQRNGGILDNPKISWQKMGGFKGKPGNLGGAIPGIESCPANLTKNCASH